MQMSVEIRSRGKVLRGSLHQPDGAEGKVPVVIILHGFGGHKAGPHFIFTKLSRLLEAQGIASVRFDFAGSGESDGRFEDMTVSGEVANASDILDYVRQLPFVDTTQVGLLGLSMGGAVASLLAGRRGGDIRSLVLWAPAGTMYDITVNDFIGPHRLHLLETQGWADFEGHRIGRAFVHDLRNLSIYSEASAYKGPVHIIHGDADTVVPISAGQLYVQAYTGRAALQVISGGDHTFDRADWEDTVNTSTVAWFRKQLT